MWHQYSNYKYKDLKYILANYYHDDFWEDYKTNEEGWKDFFKKDYSTVKDLIQDINLLFKEPSEKIHKTISEYQSGGLYLATPEEAVEWLTKCRDYVVKKLEKGEKHRSNISSHKYENEK